MRKYTHPLLKETLIQTTDGSVFLKNWLYYRTFLRLEIDFTTNKLWRKIKKENQNEMNNNNNEIIKIKKVK